VVVQPTSDVRLTYDGRHYSLHFTKELETKRVSKPGIVALDPGVRKFQTCFSERECVSFSPDMRLINNIWNKIDLLKSKKMKKELKNNPRRRILRQEKRIKNVIADLHWKTANYLCNNYSSILIPTFGTSKMVTKLAPKTSRAMMALSHYSFRQRLIHVSSKYLNNRVYVVGEEYTSMTCTRCGHINGKDGNEIKICQGCQYQVDRDVNGSRNIFLKNVQLV
jgi:putative transposase